jgi:hypothetical protein
MTSAVTSPRMRQVLLEVIRTYEGRGPGMFQSKAVLNEAMRRLYIQGDEAEQALLDAFADLFIQGVVAWGFNVTNPDPPFMHTTERGRETLRHFSRDPSNPAGYKEYLQAQGKLHLIAAGYINEALRTYAAACWRATAVLVGCAAETVVLELRDTLTKRLSALGRPGPKDLSDSRVGRVLDGIKRELDTHSKAMPAKLREEFQSYWEAFTSEIRLTRNEAGHPQSVEPVTPEDVQATLLAFPRVVGMAARLRKWVSRSMP